MDYASTAEKRNLQDAYIKLVEYCKTWEFEAYPSYSGYLEATDGEVSQSVVYVNLLTDQEGTMNDEGGTLVAQIFEILNTYAA